MIYISLVFAALFIISTLAQKKEKKEMETRAPEKPKFRTIAKINYLADTENADRFLKAYMQDLEENYEYHLSAKELKEDFENEKVYKYLPFELPHRLEGDYVFAPIEEEWYRVGRLKKNAVLDGKLTLYLFPNIYKYVTEDNIDKETDESYFGIESVKTVPINQE